MNKEDHERAKKFKAVKIRFVPGIGIDTGRFHALGDNRETKRDELGINKTDFVLLSVGELIPRKNHEIVLKSIYKLKESKEYSRIQYLICGQGSMEKNLKSLAKELDICDHVHFLGYRNDIPEICNCSDLFVFMSVHEGLPVALMEAMASGLPIICSDIRGNIDLVENRINGIVIGFDENILANEIISMMKSSKKRNEFGEEAKKAVQKYAFSEVLVIMKKIYNDEVNT